jgi:hypothetical protein
MPNVKAGDLARVVYDPQNQGVVGLQVYVVGPPYPNDYLKAANIALVQKAHGLAWEVQLLETRAFSYNGLRRLFRAGNHMIAADIALRRIDPPADSLDLLRTTHLPNELREYLQHRDPTFTKETA